MSLSRYAAQSASAAIVIAGTRFALAAIAARRLSEGGFGQFAYALWLVDIAFLSCSLGAAGTVSRYAAEFRGDVPKLGAFMREWRRKALAVPPLTALSVTLAAELSGLDLSWRDLALLAVWGLAQAGWALQTAALTGSQRFDKILLANVAAGAIMVAGVASLPFGPNDLSALFALMALAAVIGVVVGFSQVRQLGQGLSVELTAEQRRSVRAYAFNIWLTPLLWALVWSRGEFPVVRAYTGDQGLAHYAATMTVFGGAIQAMTLGVYGVMPHLTQIWGEGRIGQAVDTARRVMDTQLVVCGAVALLVTCFGPELMGLAFGASYRQSAGMLAVLAPGLLFMALATQNHLLQIDTDARFSRDTSLLGLAMLMALAASLTPAIGLEGAAFSRASTMVVLGAISAHAVRRRWKSRAVSIRNLFIVLSVCLSSAVAVYEIGDQWLAWRTAIFVTGTSVIGWALRSIDREAVIGQVLRRLKDAIAAKETTGGITEPKRES